jgi:hypothetical protein
MKLEFHSLAVQDVPQATTYYRRIQPDLAHGPAPKLQQHVERINPLPKSKQCFVMQVLESVLAQASR